MFDGSDAHYLHVGLSALGVVEAALRGTHEPRTILDLPCGFGRVTRVLRARYPDAVITACDLDRPAVEFTAATFDAKPSYSAPDFRDLNFEGVFDLIWVGSLLTHLPEHQVRQFFDFAVRHMGPNSRLVVTTHGEYVAARLRQHTYGLSEQAACGLFIQYLMDGFGYRGYDGSLSYGISLAAPTWFDSLLAGSPLRLMSYQPRGWDDHQDVLVLGLAPEVERRGGLAVNLFETGGTVLPVPTAEQDERDASGLPYFDETWYCSTYPDVLAAIGSGGFQNGFHHFLEYGRKEGRSPFDPARGFARRVSPDPAAWMGGDVGGERASRVGEAWSISPEVKAADGGWYWMAHPAVRARSNTLASGSADGDAYTRLAQLLVSRGWTMPIPQSLSIGCGFGGLERDLSARGMVEEMDAYDIAAGAIAEAARQAEELGLHKIRYHVQDLESVDLPSQSADVVFAHSSVHHVERLEALYEVVQRTLRPGGVFHLHEFVGPTRFQWTDAQLALVNAFLDSLPTRLRLLPNGAAKEKLRRPTIEEMISADPSEAVRSAELVEALAPYFDIIEYRQLGGALSHLALGGIAQNFDPNSAKDSSILQSLFDMEDQAMANGVIGSDFATITAVPKIVRVT